LEITTVPPVKILISRRWIDIERLVSQLWVVQCIVHMMTFDGFVIKFWPFVFHDVIGLLALIKN
jgi:hypothetical protein